MRVALLFAVAALALLAAQAIAAVGAPPGEAEVHRCHGRQATIVGTAGDDVLRGRPIAT